VALPSTIEGKVNGNGGALSDSEGLASLEAGEGAHCGLERAAEQFRIRRRHSWCSKILYYVVRTVDLSRGEGTRYEKRHGYHFISIGFRIISPRKSIKLG